MFENGTMGENKENQMVIDASPKDNLEDHEEYQYLNLLRSVMKNGKIKIDRTNVGTKSMFGAQSRYSLRDGLLHSTRFNKNFALYTKLI